MLAMRQYLSYVDRIKGYKIDTDYVTLIQIQNHVHFRDLNGRATVRSYYS